MKPIFTRTPDAAGDKAELRELHDMLSTASLEDVQRFCEGMMNALVVAEDVFRKRFPAEFEAWEASDFFHGDHLP